MNPRDASPPPELFELLEALCEDRLTPADVQRLEQLVLSDAAARRAYLAYVDLHGTLHWNAAHGADGANFEPAVSPHSVDVVEVEPVPVKRRALGLWITAASVALIATLSFALGRWFSPPQDARSIANKPGETIHQPTDDSVKPKKTTPATEHPDGESAPGIAAVDDVPNKPVVISRRPDSSDPIGDEPKNDSAVVNNTAAARPTT